jgi:serine/threonine-protein kinase
MGAVYLVEHVHTGEQLALKLLLAHVGADANTVERFKREARAPARIRSEHVVRVTDADVAPELGGAPFMVMEALEGKDLEGVVEERGALPPSEVVWLLTQVASALDRAHGIGVVHRDLKPENIFLHTRTDGTPIVKILDFGISKMGGKEGGDVNAAGLTQTGAVMGTPMYMSPEQARGHTASIGPGTDIWAMGLIALRLLTGGQYWQAQTLADLLMHIMADPMPPPSVRFPALGTRIDAWFARSCDRDPSRRFTSVGEQVQALSLALGVTSTAAAPLTSPLSGTVSSPMSAAPAYTTQPAQQQVPAQYPATFGQSTASGAAVAHPSVNLPPPQASSGARGFVWGLSAVMLVGALIGAGLGVRHFVAKPAPATAAGPSGLPSASATATPVAAETATTTTAAPVPVPASAAPTPSSTTSASSASSVAATGARPHGTTTRPAVPPSTTSSPARPTVTAAPTAAAPSSGRFNPQAP